MQKNLFEFFALIGDRDAKTSPSLVPGNNEPPGGISTS